MKQHYSTLKFNHVVFKILPRKARNCLLRETDISTSAKQIPILGIGSLQGSFLPLRTQQCWVSVQLFEKRFYSSRRYFRIFWIKSLKIKVVANVFTQLQLNLRLSTILHGCFTQEIHRLRNWTGHCLSPDGERLLGPAIPLIYASRH